MTLWWEASQDERYWCEITDRPDIGADLKCPQADEQGKPYWSYSLIRSVWPGDVVFHYSTRAMAFVGVSVAGGPLEERPIVWAPHGTVGRVKNETRQARAGWWLPLFGHIQLPRPLTLDSLQAPDEQTWIRQWIADKQKAGSVSAPFQLYPGKLRAAQGYLTKMPFAFVSRWEPMKKAAERLARFSDDFDGMAQLFPPTAVASSVIGVSAFAPKSDADYVAFIKGGQQRRTRSHETLVKAAGEFLSARGALVATPHPLDLTLGNPTQVIFEAKACGSRSAGFAIREAVGQLHEYRHFIGPRTAQLCILLDRPPEQPLIEFVEQALGMLLMWRTPSGFGGAPNTVDTLRHKGQRLLG